MKDETVLTLACVSKDEGVINVLLNACADLDIKDNAYGDTFLHKAVRRKCSIAELQAIVDHGVDVNATNKKNQTVLTLACVNKYEGAINVLLNASANLDIKDNAYGDTCLHKAVRQKCTIYVLQAIIDHGVDVNALNKGNKTALRMSCVNKNESAINVLLNAGANPSIIDADGNTCLHIAVTQECSKKVLQAIIDHGVGVNATNKRNQTALTIACANKNESAIKVLLNAGADPNIADADGDTCLYIAVKQRCSKEVLQAINETV